MSLHEDSFLKLSISPQGRGTLEDAVTDFIPSETLRWQRSEWADVPAVVREAVSQDLWCPWRRRVRAAPLSCRLAVLRGPAKGSAAPARTHFKVFPRRERENWGQTGAFTEARGQLQAH